MADASWNAIGELHRRGTPATLSLAQSLARSASTRKRALGLYVASQLRAGAPRGRWPSEPYAVEETQRMLLLGLNDPHFEVVRAAVSGLGHRPHADALQGLVALSRHQSAHMRWDVAVTLAGYSEPAAVEALLQLASDEESEVRDWATFGLGTQSDADNSDIRAMLWKNAHDVDSDVRGEALVGLARRQDPRAVSLLKSRLTDECRVYEFDAAQALKDPALAGPLRALREAVDRETGIDPFWHAQLLAALEACSGGPSTG